MRRFGFDRDATSPLTPEGIIGRKAVSRPPLKFSYWSATVSRAGSAACGWCIGKETRKVVPAFSSLATLI
jgi:hypothetical protein